MPTSSSGRAQDAKDQEILDAIRNGPTATTDKSYIGVPPGYTAGKQPTVGYGDTLPENPQGQGIRKPRYAEGDELRPANWTPDQIADLQRKMAEAGLLKSKFRLGYWDGASQQAYSALLAYANQGGRSATDTLNVLRTRPEQGDDTDRPPLVVKTTSPDDLRGVFRDVSRKLLGRQLGDGEIESYIQAYNSIETQRQQQAYNMEPTGGTVQGIPAASAYVEERLRKERPIDVKSEEIGSRADEFFSLLGPFGGAD